LFALFLIGLPALLIINRVNELRNREAQEQQRRIGYLLARGADEMRKGDFAASLPFLLNAAAEDHSDLRSHRLRIGAVMAHASRPQKIWKSPTAEFSADGRWLLAQDGQSLTIDDSLSGRVIRRIQLPFHPEKIRISPDSSVIAATSSNEYTFFPSGGTPSRIQKLSPEYGLVLDAAIHPSNEWMAVLASNGKTILSNSRTGVRKVISTPGMWTIRFDPNGSKLLAASTNWYCRIYDFPTGKPFFVDFPQPLAYRGVFSPDGAILVTCGFRQAKCWELTAPHQRGYSLASDDAVVSAAFSPDGSILATGSYNGRVYLWNGTNFQALAQNHILYHPQRIEEVAFVGNKKLVAHCNDGSNYVWDLAPARERIEKVSGPIPNFSKLSIDTQFVKLNAGSNGVSGSIGSTKVHLSNINGIEMIAAAPAGNVFAVGLRDDGFRFQEALLFHAGAQEPFQRLVHRDGILSIEFSPDGKQVLTASEDYSAVVWDVQTGHPITAPMQHNAQVRWACFSSDARWVATVSQDPVTDIAVAIVWDAKTGDPITPPMVLPDTAKFVCFENDDASLLVSNGISSYRLFLPFASGPLEKYRGALPAPPNVSRASPQISSASRLRRVPAFFASQSASRF
jgi:WD40 repeat protein